MRPLLALLLLFYISSFSCFGQAGGVTTGKKSDWIERVSYDASSRPDNAQGQSHYYLLLDEQEHRDRQENYYHYAYVILNAEGIQEMSDLTFDFDPAYQNLVVHEIKVVRENKVIDQIPASFNVIQREQSMDRYLYDGSKTAIVNLRDIRAGDIVEYSFTRKGYNPIYENHISQNRYFDYNTSFDKLYVKLITPSSKKLVLKELGDGVPKPKITREGNNVHYEWSVGKTTHTPLDSGIPVWHNVSKMVMISDFTSWGDVGDWARKLFALKPEDIRRLNEEVVKNFPETGDQNYVLEVIRFVQDEVRYLGFESGINSHKPHPPLQVYEQRFGDCKDKSLLLTTLLKAKNIEAYPMLVNTSLKHALDERIPSGHIFDHCVVKIIFRDSVIYVDPTMSSQGGRLHDIYFPNYRRGLVIDDDISGLEELPEPETPTTTELQEFDVMTVGGEAMLTIRTTYTGADADMNRSYFANTPIENVKKNYRDFYANLYPDITEWEEIKVTDDRTSNVFTVEEKYKIPTFWKPFEGKENQIYCLVQQQSLSSYFDVPKNIQQRTTPYYLSYPVDFYHTIHIRLPEEWTLSPEDQVIDSDYYLYEYEVRNRFREVTLLTHYKTKKDHIPADQVATYVNDHTKMFNNVGYQLSYDNRASASSTPWAGVLLTIFSLVGGALLMVYLYHRYDPQPARYMVAGSPIGGWLVLMGIGVAFAPLRLIIEFFNEPLLINGDGWMASYATERYGLFSYLFVIHMYNVVKLVFSILLLVLFFQRRTSFPKLMIIQLISSAIIISADELIAEAISTDGTKVDSFEIVRTLITTAIWVPYLIFSQRVKETFVMRAEGHDNDDESPVSAVGNEAQTTEAVPEASA